MKLSLLRWAISEQPTGLWRENKVIKWGYLSRGGMAIASLTHIRRFTLKRKFSFQDDGRGCKCRWNQGQERTTSQVLNLQIHGHPLLWRKDVCFDSNTKRGFCSCQSLLLACEKFTRHSFKLLYHKGRNADRG